MNFEPHPTDPDKLVIKMQPYHIAKYTEEELQAAIKAENEACAKLCEELLTEPKLVGWNGFEHYMTQCAQRIRARGDKHD